MVNAAKEYAPGSIVLAYCGTSNGAVMRRLLYTISQQRIMDRRRPPSGLFERLLVTDTDASNLPETVVEFFGPDRIVQRSAVVTDATGTHFSLSAFRNAMLDYVSEHAEERGYRWLVLCDSDTVFPMDRWIEPQSGFAVPQVYWQKGGDETIDQSLLAIGDGSDTSVFSNGNSWYTLRRDVFTRFRFNEMIYGYGHEDIEFGARLHANDLRPEVTDIAVIHVWHEGSERNIVKAQNLRNALMTEITRTLERRGPVFIEPPIVRFVEASHPHWREPTRIALVLSHGRAVQARDKNWGDFTLDGGELLIQWDNYRAERFSEEDGIFRLVRDDDSLLVAASSRRTERL